MEIKIKKTKSLNDKIDTLIICSSINDLKELQLSKDELDFVRKSIKNKEHLIALNQYKRWIFIQLLPEKKKGNELLETLRKSGSKLKARFNKHHIKRLVIRDISVSEKEIYAFLEGLILSHYTFLKYFEKKEEKANKLNEILVLSSKVEKDYAN